MMNEHKSCCRYGIIISLPWKYETFTMNSLSMYAQYMTIISYKKNVEIIQFEDLHAGWPTKLMKHEYCNPLSIFNK